MNRREAMAALMALPATARISAAQVKPSDVIVVEIEGAISQERADIIKHKIEAVWPGRKVLVVSEGLKIKIVEG